jgi:ribosomal protein S18 acetylase RimI-like enzyme
VSVLDIAPCAEADLPELFGLAKGVFADLPGWNDREVLDALKSDVLFVARDEGLPAGYVALRHEQDGALLVEQLLVAPGHRQQGVGHRLLEHVEEYGMAERAPALRIVVERTNSAARDFYRRWGFVPIEPELFELLLPTSA